MKSVTIFYYTMPEEIIEDTESEQLKKIRIAGIDFLVPESNIDEWTEEQKEVWMHLAELIFKSEYSTGLCNHAVLICRK